ncbi:MAG: hypothetical protein ACD_41C00014G0002 [uncultured bacterium]|nr:MAG: hypothetical protein ACD_41C00014G0002 [uncultured bacterium]
MVEPIGRDPRQPRREPRTEKFAELFENNLFDRRRGEEGPFRGELIRDALVVVRQADNIALQFHVRVTFDPKTKIVFVTVEPTQGALADHPEIRNQVFTADGTGQYSVRATMQKVVDKLQAVGFTLDTTAARMLHARE